METTLLKPKGETVFTYKNSASEKEGTTKATIGNGSIVIAGNTQNTESDLIRGLNRDVNKSQEVTNDIITSASDFELHVDNRVLWQLPNNVLGATNALANIAAGYATGKPVDIKIGEKGIEITGAKLGDTRAGGSAITLGYFEVYYGKAKADEIRFGMYGANDNLILGYHEDTHIDQQQAWGPLFIPLYLVTGGWWSGTDSPFEAGANQGARDRMKKIGVYDKYNEKFNLLSR